MKTVGDAWRDKVYPRRGAPFEGTPQASAEALFAQVVTLLDGGYDHDMKRVDRASLTLGLSRCDPGWKPHAKAALERYAPTRDPSAGALELDVEVALAVLAGVDTQRRWKGPYGYAHAPMKRTTSPELDALVAWWCVRKGLAFAVAALVRSHDVALSTLGSAPHLEAFDMSAEPWDRPWTAWNGNPLPREQWASLRRAVALADDAQYAAARDLAATLRAKAPPPVRSFLAFAFPTEPWAEFDARALLAQGAFPKHAGGALACALTPEAAAAVAAALPGEHFVLRFLPTLVDVQGAAAVPALEALLAKKPEIVASRRALVEALDRARTL